jgi:gamma-glutamyl-gamma-aminobutyrate hydrolase PuuD
MHARIGITTSLETDTEDGDRQTLRRAYIRAVERAGGLPVVAPMLEGEPAARVSPTRHLRRGTRRLMVR